MNYHSNNLIEAANCLDSYVDLENELITLAGFNLRTLIDKLKDGYTLQEPTPPSPIKFTEDGTPHLIDATTIFDIERGFWPVYVLNVDVTWDDLDEEERRILSESQEYSAKVRRNKILCLK